MTLEYSETMAALKSLVVQGPDISKTLEFPESQALHGKTRQSSPLSISARVIAKSNPATKRRKRRFLASTIATG